MLVAVGKNVVCGVAMALAAPISVRSPAAWSVAAQAASDMQKNKPDNTRAAALKTLYLRKVRIRIRDIRRSAWRMRKQ